MHKNSHLLNFLRPQLHLTGGFLQPGSCLAQSALHKHARAWKPYETWLSCSGAGVLQRAWDRVGENGPQIALAASAAAAASGSWHRVPLVRAGHGAFHLPPRPLSRAAFLGSNVLRLQQPWPEVPPFLTSCLVWFLQLNCNVLPQCGT